MTNGWISANPMDAPMNGAVQGVATTVASTPARNDPDKPPCCRRPLPPTRVSDVPMVRMPDRLNPSANRMNARLATMSGDCS